MSCLTPSRSWWSASEIAEAGLPDMPSSTRAVQLMARREGWAAQPGKMRRRRGRGGGMEYHVSLFPTRAKLALTRTPDPAPDPSPSARPRDAAWADFEALSDKAKAKAQDRLQALDEIDALECAGLNRSEAVRAIARERQTSEKTLWNWLALVAGADRADWMACLAPRPSGAKGVRIQVDERFTNLVKASWLTLSKPPLTAAYEWAERSARAEGIPVAPLHQIRRIIAQTVPKYVEVLKREGPLGLRRHFPHQTRDKTYMHALEGVQADYHKFDVFVTVPGETGPQRIQMVAFSDIYSGKFLSYRLSMSANSHTVQLAFGDVIRNFGIPEQVLFDNGHEFAAKVITGGAPTRFRFKVKDGDAPGLAVLLGITVHWAEPGHGQSKPIERAFRDLCDRVAKHPAHVGAYTGNNPNAKPENYGDRAVPLEEFVKVLEVEIAAHNARRGRRSEVANLRSFDEVFADSYANAPIRLATDEQKRLWLMQAEGVRGDRKTGEIKLHGTRYWSEWMHQIAGQQVIARFDPEDLQAGLHIYDMKGVFLGPAAIASYGGFFNVEDAKTHKRKLRSFEKATREAAKAHSALSASELAARLRAAGLDVPPGDLPEPQVVSLPRPHSTAPKTRPAPETSGGASVTDISRHRPAAQTAPDEDGEAMFARALELQAMQEAGQRLTDEQTDWLSTYTASPDYRNRLRLRAVFGED